MPRVPVVPTLQASTRALPAPQQRGVNPDPLGDVAGAVRQTGDVLMRVAVQERDRADETRILDAENQLTSASTRALTGFFEKRGQTALGGSQTLLDEFDKMATGTTAQLNERQRQRLAPRLANMRQSLESGALRHEANEHTRYSVETAESSQRLAIEQGLTNPADPKVLGLAVAKIADSIRVRGDLSGWGKETRDEKLLEAESQLFAGSVLKLSGLEQHDAAQKLFDATQGRMTDDQRQRARQALERSASIVKAQDWFAGAQKTYGSDYMAMRKAAQAGLSGEDEKNALSQIDYWDSIASRAKAEQRQRQREYEQDMEKRVNAAVARGDDLSPTMWRFIDQQGMTRDVKRRQQAILNGEDAVTDARRYNVVMALPREALAKVDPQSFVGDFAPQDIERLRKAVDAAKSPTSASYILHSTQESMTKSVATGMGLWPRGKTAAKLTEVEAERYESYAGRVRDLTESVQDAKGRRLTAGEFKAEVLDVVSRNYLTHRTGDWFGSDSLVYAPDLAPEDAGVFRARPLPPQLAAQYGVELEAMGARDTEEARLRYDALRRRNVPLERIRQLMLEFK